MRGKKRSATFSPKIEGPHKNSLDYTEIEVIDKMISQFYQVI